MFDRFLYQPLLFSLNTLAQFFNGELGWAIITLTLALRLLLLPVALPSLKALQKMRDLKPELDLLKKKHTDKMALQKAQLALYQKHGVNPAAGCLPNIAQLVILFALNSVIHSATNQNPNLNTHFFWLDLTKPDPLFVLPILAGISQLLLSAMLSPAIEHHPEKTAKKTEDVKDMAETMQQQMLLFMPIMTAFIAIKFPSGLALYWVATTIFSVAQQYFISGWGGLTTILRKLNSLVGFSRA